MLVRKLQKNIDDAQQANVFVLSRKVLQTFTDFLSPASLYFSRVSISLFFITIFFWFLYKFPFVLFLSVLFAALAFGFSMSAPSIYIICKQKFELSIFPVLHDTFSRNHIHPLHFYIRQ